LCQRFAAEGEEQPGGVVEQSHIDDHSRAAGIAAQLGPAAMTYSLVPEVIDGTVKFRPMKGGDDVRVIYAAQSAERG
jgi:hypothetical protein